MSDKLNVSIVLPIKSSRARDFAEYFGKAIQSIKNQIVGVDELVIVHTQEESLVTFLNSFDLNFYCILFFTRKIKYTFVLFILIKTPFFRTEI